MELCIDRRTISSAEFRNNNFDDFRNTNFWLLSMSCAHEIFKTFTIKNLSAAKQLLHTTTAHDANDNGCSKECAPIFVQICEKPLF